MNVVYFRFKMRHIILHYKLLHFSAIQWLSTSIVQFFSNLDLRKRETLGQKIFEGLLSLLQIVRQ